MKAAIVERKQVEMKTRAKINNSNRSEAARIEDHVNHKHFSIEANATSRKRAAQKLITKTCSRRLRSA